ncbi:MAG: hypothetical protein GY705_21660 [Bacteroidetes bacterium]|nr:hypothetical protein [Bacteroidota bacterium]
MARKKSKKRKGRSKGQKQYSLSDVSMRFHQGNYKLALRTLANAKVRSEEAAKAKELKVNICHHLAYDHFCKQEFESAIKAVSSVLNMQAKEGQQFPLEVTTTLVGLCHLYMGNFQKAESCLQASIEKENTRMFGFYYLLAILYQARYESFSRFKENFASYFSHLDESRLEYLEIFFHLLKREYDTASHLLAAHETDSHIQHLNFNALQAIINKNNKSVSHSTKLKPLYRLLLRYELSATEKTYLSSYQALSPYFEELQQKEKDTLNLLRIRQLCEEGEPLLDVDFSHLLQNIPEDLQPYVVYNQLALLYNSKNFQDNYNGILSYFKKNSRLFFRIPESIFLYLSFVYFDSDKHIASSFFSNIDQYLKNFGHLLSNSKLNRLGWMIFSCMDDNPDFTKLSNIGKRGIYELASQYPNIVAFQLWLMVEASVMPASSQKGKLHLDLFSDPDVQNQRKEIIKHLDAFYRKMYPQESLLPFAMFSRKEDLHFFKTIIKQFTEQLLKSINDSSVAVEAKVVLDIFNLLHKYLAKLFNESEVKADSLYKSIKTGYQKALDYFDEKQENSPYFQDYKTFLLLPKMAKISSLLEEQPWNLEKSLAKLVKEGAASVILDMILRNIEDSDFNSYYIPPLRIFLKVQVDHAQERSVEFTESFIHAFKNKFQNIYYAPSDEYYLELLKNCITKLKSSKYHKMIYTLVRGFRKELTEVEVAVYYNTAGKVLQFLMQAITNQPDFEYDASFVDELLQFTGDVAKKRKLKGLGAIHKQAEVFFNNGPDKTYRLFK